MKSVTTQEAQLLFFGLSIVTGLFLISLIRIFLLSRANGRMRVENSKMEKQAALQQLEVTAIQHDAMSWRAKNQRQFDALRSELSHRLQQSDLGGTHALKEFAEAHKKALAKIAELEAALSTRPAAVGLPPPVTSALPKPPPPSQPGLPTMDSLRIQSLETELAAAKAEIASGRHHNAALQRALLLARRRLPTPAMRKSAPRSTARSA